MLRPTTTARFPAGRQSISWSIRITPQRRAGHGGRPALCQQSHVDRMQPIGVLLRTEPAEERVGVDLLRHRELHRMPCTAGSALSASSFA